MAEGLQPGTTNARLSVGFILAKRFTLSAFASFVDVLRLSADEGDRSRQILCQWEFISSTMDPVVSSCGISLQPDGRLGDPTRFDYIVVVGGLIDEIDTLDPSYIAFLTRAADAKIPLVGLCTGGFILHKAGLMSGYRCCVSWFHHDDFLYQFDGLKPVSDQIFVVDQDRLTCSGGISSAHLAAYIVEKHVGIAQARKSLRIMIIDEAMAGDRAQPGIPLELTTSDDLVQRALHFMQQNMDNPLTIDNIAQKLDVGRRKLERRFQSILGMSPAEADKLMRIEHAKQIMCTTKRTISQIAADAGFCDASHFIRVFKERNGETPSAFRNTLGD